MPVQWTRRPQDLGERRPQDLGERNTHICCKMRAEISWAKRGKMLLSSRRIFIFIYDPGDVGINYAAEVEGGGSILERSVNFRGNTKG